MGHISRRPVRPPSLKIMLASGLAGILSLSAFAGVSGATAADTTFNPFEVNGGFTLLVQGNAVLNNGELEGSIAVDGSLASGNPNGYPVVHHVAGSPDYAVPVIDGEPVRILAGGFAGPGSFEISNRSAVPGSPEALATARFSDVAGLTGSARGSNWLRVTNADGGNLDLPTVAYDPSHAADLALLRTALPSVADYFPQRTALLDRNARCLAAMYDGTGLVHEVPLRSDGAMVFPGPYAANRPNVLDYSDLADRIIKPDAAAGYQPTAEAPLVIRVDAGTTELKRLGFEGWSAQGEGQKLSRHIFIDASAVTGPLTVDGLELGAVYAPHADVIFATGVSHNGQWITGSFASSGGGELHHHSFLGQLPCAAASGGEPTDEPTDQPSEAPTGEPTTEPTDQPGGEPTTEPTEEPTSAPTGEPSEAPTGEPTTEPTYQPGGEPTTGPTDRPATTPSGEPTSGPAAPGSDSVSRAPFADDGGAAPRDKTEPSRLASTGAAGIAWLATAALSLMILGGTALALRRRSNA